MISQRLSFKRDIGLGGACERRDSQAHDRSLRNYCLCRRVLQEIRCPRESPLGGARGRVASTLGSPRSFQGLQGAARGLQVFPGVPSKGLLKALKKPFKGS